MNLIAFLIAFALCNLPALAFLYAAVAISSHISHVEEQQEQNNA